VKWCDKNVKQHEKQKTLRCDERLVLLADARDEEEKT
jgi:hypothetical protein